MAPFAALRRAGPVALVLGAGGPVGFSYHAGALHALADAGWDARQADTIVGTSIGAVTGALLRAGLAPADLAAQAAGRALSEEGQRLIDHGWSGDPLEIDVSARRTRGTPSSPTLLRSLARRPHRVTLGLILAALAPTGTVETATIRDGFDTVLGGRWPDGRLGIVAADLDSGERVVFDGSAGVSPGTAIAASCAVPSYFAPVVADGRRYVDGGAVSPSNVDVAGHGPTAPDQVLAVVPMGIRGRPGRRGVDLPGRWLNARHARSGLRRLAQGGSSTTLLAPGAAELGVMGYDAFDVSRLPEIVDRAYEATLARILRSPNLTALWAGAGHTARRAVTVGTGTGGASPT